MKNLTDALGKIGFSEALATRLREEEQKVIDAKRRLATAKRSSETKRILPHPSVITGFATNFFKTLEGDRDRARKLLLRYMPPIVMTSEQGGYKTTGGLNLGLVLMGGAPRGGGGLQPAVENGKSL